MTTDFVFATDSPPEPAVIDLVHRPVDNDLARILDEAVTHLER
ncbi:MAG: hypothetical protein WAV85_17935 [Rhodoferax sp.]